MPQQYSIEEALEMAIQLERNGEEFYTAAAKHARHESAKAFLLEMAKWEKDHQRLFKEIRDSIPQADRAAPVAPGGEAAAYLHAMVAGKVFELHDQPLQQFLGQATLALILEQALAMEKEAILFYLGVRELVTAGKEKVDEVIAEEMRHVSIITEQMSVDTGLAGPHVAADPRRKETQ